MKIASIAALAVTLSGCVYVPSVEYAGSNISEGEDYPEMHFLAQEVKCHLVAAMAKHYPAIEPPNDFWRVKVTVTNTSTDDTGAKADAASWIIPWSVDKFTLKPNAGHKKTLLAEGQMVFDLSIEKNPTIIVCPSDAGKISHRFKPADFGLKKWITELPRETDNPDYTIGLSTLGYKAEVEVISNAGIGGTIEDTNITAPLSASGQRKRKQTIILAGTAAKTAAPAATGQGDQKGASRSMPKATTINEADKINRDATDRVILERFIDRSIQ